MVTAFGRSLLLKLYVVSSFSNSVRPLPRTGSSCLLLSIWIELNDCPYSYYLNLLSETVPNKGVKDSSVVLVSRYDRLHFPACYVYQESRIHAL